MTASDASPNSAALPTLSIVIPAFEEAGNIGPLLEEIGEVFADVPPLEVIVVDDGSRDETASVVTATALRIPYVRLLRHRARAGKSLAILSGMRRARGDWAATLDGDGQNDPRDLAQIWREWRDTPPDPTLGLLCGRRRRRNDGLVKLATSRVGNFLRRVLLKDATHDTGCGFKVFRRYVFLELPYFDNMHRFYPALVRRAGHAVTERWIDDRPRRHGVSKYGFFDRLAVGISDLFGVAWLCRRWSRAEVEEREPK